MVPDDPGLPDERVYLLRALREQGLLEIYCSLLRELGEDDHWLLHAVDEGDPPTAS